MDKKRNGVKEWIFQRVSNLLIFSYAIFYIVNLLVMGDVNYEAWVAFHSTLWFKLFSSATLVIVMLNSLLAGWQIGTDYTQKVPISGFGRFFHGFYSVTSIVFLCFGIFILWFM